MVIRTSKRYEIWLDFRIPSHGDWADWPGPSASSWHWVVSHWRRRGNVFEKWSYSSQNEIQFQPNLIPCWFPLSANPTDDQMWGVLSEWSHIQKYSQNSGSLLTAGIAVITVEPAHKISFVYNCMETRLRAEYNGKWPISLVCVSRPLVTVVTASKLRGSVYCFGSRCGIWRLVQSVPKTSEINRSCLSIIWCQYWSIWKIKVWRP